MIYIYADMGVGPIGIKSIKSSLQRVILAKEYQVREIKAAQVIAAKWREDAALFILPGGSSKYYCDKLNGAGNNQIRSFISEGGSFLAICAGCYYSTKNIEFGKGEKYEYIQERELALFEGKIEGPTFKPFSYDSYVGVRASLQILPDGSTVRLYYKGGGHFLDVEKTADLQILGVYEDGRVSMIKFPYGKGIVVLSNVHFEMDHTFFPKENAYLMEIVPELAQHDNKRLALFGNVLNQLGIQTDGEAIAQLLCDDIVQAAEVVVAASENEVECSD